MPLILAPRRQRQTHLYEFRASQGYTVSKKHTQLKKPNQTNKHKPYHVTHYSLPLKLYPFSKTQFKYALLYDSFSDFTH